MRAAVLLPAWAAYDDPDFLWGIGEEVWEEDVRGRCSIPGRKVRRCPVHRGKGEGP